MATLTEKTLAFYDEIASQYDASLRTPMHVAMDREEKEGIKKWLGTSRIALDVGCGTGRITRFLEAEGLEVIGLDISRPMLLAAKSSKQRLELVQATADALPFVDHSFDITVSVWGCLSHVDAPYHTLEEIARVTKKRVIFSIYGRLAYTVLLKATAPIRSPLQALGHVIAGNTRQIPVRHYSITDFLDHLPPKTRLVNYVGIVLLPMFIPNSVPSHSALVELAGDLDSLLLKIPLLKGGALSFLVAVDVVD